MPIETHAYAAGAYRKAKEVFVKDGGAWRDLKEIWVNDQGVWRKVFTKFFEYNADISGYNFNLRDAAMATGQWDGVVPVLANLRVVGNLGARPPEVPAYRGGDNDYNQLRRQRMVEYSNHPAFDSGSLPASSEINLTVMPNVFLTGAGGEAGTGYHTTVNAGKPNQQLDSFPWGWENGGNGSPAIRTSVLTRITNNGIIGGGGGGGAGGLGPIHQTYWSGKGFTAISAGGHGGSGAGNIPGNVLIRNPMNTGDAPTSNFGTVGSQTTGGSGGAVWTINGASSGTPGGRGGDLGQPGGDGGSRLSLDVANFAKHLRSGGLPGHAVIGSSFVEWQAYGDVRGPLA